MTMIAVIGRAGRIIYEVVLDVLNMPVGHLTACASVVW